MALYPAVQKRAQEEIDHVVGTERLPDFEDGLFALRRSPPPGIFRWWCVAPQGLPHIATADDAYNGFYFSKGKSTSFMSILELANTWLSQSYVILSLQNSQYDKMILDSYGC